MAQTVANRIQQRQVPLPDLLMHRIVVACNSNDNCELSELNCSRPTMKPKNSQKGRNAQFIVTNSNSYLPMFQQESDRHKLI